MSTSESESQSETPSESGSESQSPDPVTAGLLDQLREELGRQTEKAIFTCGGTIPITKPGETLRIEETKFPSASEPVTIRWDPASPETPASQAKVVLPLDRDSQGSLEKLVGALEPASFGYHGKNVFDENYRKALKMDTTQFASTFNPYEFGIIDSIAQMLLPSTSKSDLARGLRAELYKMNVYSGPSGKFKAHVDTPRANSQVGSLVVCLPLQHEGGQLQVRHKGREVTYDWGSHADRISWAAFYSDCEHEVLEVKSGYRLTLTYNLYAVRGGGMLTGIEPPVLDATQLPIYRSLKSVIANKDFMPEGGYLGLFCSHAYAHTNTESVILPEMLKGLDMAVWETFGRLGLEASVKPVLRDEGEDYLEGEEYERDNWVVGNDRAVRLSKVGQAEYSEVKDLCIEQWRGGETLSFEEIHWLTDPSHKEIQLPYIVYGNDMTLEWFYSFCAIVARVQPSADRPS